MRSLSDYVRIKSLPNKSIDDYREAVDLLIKAEGSSFGTPKSFASEFEVSCRTALNQTVRTLARANQIPSDPTDDLTILEKSTLVKALQTVLTQFENQAKLYDNQLNSVNLVDYEKADSTNNKKSDGKVRTLSTGGKCTIIITKEAWTKIEKDNANPEQIKGILAQDPIQILPSGKIKGQRCIKPEQYGWVFSTSSSNRLVDSSTSTSNFPPSTLIFDTYKTNVSH